MEKELQGKLVEILTSIQNGVGQAKDFALSQLPDVAQSYVVYGRVISLLWLVFGLASMVAGVTLANKAKQDEHGVWKFQSAVADFGGGYWLAAFVGVFGGVLTVFSLDWAVLVWFAPKVWLLKEIAHLVK